MARFLGRTRPFWISLFLTLCLFSVTAGLLTVDYRCRMMTDPPVGEPVSFSLTLAEGERNLHIQWFDMEKELYLQASDPLQRVLEAIPILIPRGLRTAAGAKQIAENLWEELPFP